MHSYSFLIAAKERRYTESEYMPKKWRLVTFLAFLTVIIYQPATAQKFSLGVKAGPNFTTGRFKDSDLRDQFNAKPVLGYLIGGVIVFPIKNNYSFGAEVGFSQKGKKLQFNDNTWTNKAGFSFIDMSMALKKSYEFQLRPDVRSKVIFGVGPNIAYWIKGKGKIDAGGPTAEYSIVFNQEPDGNFNINYYNNINRWLFGLDFGVGMEAPISSTQKILTEVRFTFGQTNLGKVNSTSDIEILGFQDDLRMNLKTLSISATYLFSFDLKESKMGRSTKDKVIKRKRN